jgi:hypothetical protein
MEFEMVSREDLGERLLGTSPPSDPSSSSSVPVTLYIGRDFAHLLSDQSELVPLVREKAQCVVRFPNGTELDDGPWLDGPWLQWIAALFSMGTSAGVFLLCGWLIIPYAFPRSFFFVLNFFSFGVAICLILTVILHIVALATIKIDGRFRFLKQFMRSRPIYLISLLFMLTSNLVEWQFQRSTDDVYYQSH